MYVINIYSNIYCNSVRPFNHSALVKYPIDLAFIFQAKISITISSGSTPISIQNLSMPSGPKSYYSIKFENS